MSARGLDTEYLALNPAAAWPVRPWAALGPAVESAAADAVGPAAEAAEPVEAGRRKQSDRGASAVEWVVITAIVVAIVTGVGVLISNAVKDKAKNACQQIVSTDTTAGNSSGSCDSSSK